MNRCAAHATETCLADNCEFSLTCAVDGHARPCWGCCDVEGGEYHPMMACPVHQNTECPVLVGGK